MRTEAAVLGSARLDLEPLRARHAAEMFAGLQAPALYRWTPEAPPPTLDWLRRRYARLEARCSPDGRQAWLNWVLRARADGQCIGYVQATVELAERVADVAYVLFLDYQGQGYGREAMAALLPWLFAHYGLRHVDARIDPHNERSLALARALGFSLLSYLPGVDALRGMPADVYRMRLYRPSVPAFVSG